SPFAPVYLPMSLNMAVALGNKVSRNAIFCGKTL
ncbi:MAG: hypothetical protein ACI88G_000521, partial [Woeseiaceae bacterium]